MIKQNHRTIACHRSLTALSCLLQTELQPSTSSWLCWLPAPAPPLYTKHITPSRHHPSATVVQGVDEHPHNSPSSWSMHTVPTLHA
mmetsp:Transcript_33965/g.85950  ORF Transcript_33965/g.85950 Transcript_33965/m.85950 type:complete len:86 (+) Transcript_33965:486-743(+)